MDDVDQVLVTGTGVSAKVVEYCRKLGPQETTLMREQLNELKRELQQAGDPAEKDEATLKLVARIEKRMAEYVNRPACASISSLVFVEVTVAPDAEPGVRELRLATPRGVSNPLVFHVGQLPEFSRKPMITSDFQVLGKEELALRKRPPDEVEQRISVPCTANGQVASGEVNWYRFEARKGQRLVLSAAARELIPYIADAVPGWFQPVLAVCDASGKELAYNDDFRFKPDPTLIFEVPQDGEYLFSITDAIFRGREDFVYRVTIGELPLVTSIFPLGGQVGAVGKIEMKGWNLETAELTPPPADAGPGVHLLAASKDEFVSNRVPFALDTLPEGFDQEPNNDASSAQKVQLPIILNGRMDRANDEDVFQVEGRAGDSIVAEVTVRRLDSPLDSLLRVTDASGKVLAFNDDHEDAGAGTNTHHADSYLMVTLPADGKYFVHLTDTARTGGDEYAYRLRISAPQPDFALRVVPSSVTLRGKGTATVSVYAIRKDGFTGEIKLSLKDPPEGFSSVAHFPVGNAGSGEADGEDHPDGDEGTRQPDRRRPGEDSGPGRRPRGRAGGRQDAGLPVAASRSCRGTESPGLRPVLHSLRPNASRRRPRSKRPPTAPSAPPKTEPPKFTKSQVTGRLRQLKILYEDWLLTDDFYARKVAECEALRRVVRFGLAIPIRAPALPSVRSLQSQRNSTDGRAGARMKSTLGTTRPIPAGGSVTSARLVILRGGMQSRWPAADRPPRPTGPRPSVRGRWLASKIRRRSRSGCTEPPGRARGA